MAGADFDPALVVRLRIEADSGTFQFGSGYLVAAGLVLTAGHVLTLDDDVAPPVGAPCQVKSGETDWRPGAVEWASDRARDVALVRTPELGAAITPTAWGMLAGTRRRQWRAAGFPVASLDEGGRAIEDAWGTVSPVTQAETGRLGLTVESRVARPRGLADRADSGWAGLSGAAVFCGEVLVGVITSDSGRYERSLIATRVEAVAHDTELADAFGETPDVRLVAGDTARDIVGCRRRRRFDAILRREDVGFGGRETTLAALNAFLADPARCLLLVEAPAGYGKTALLANLVGDHTFPHAYHFFVHDDLEMATERGFLASLVEQLEALHGVDAESRADDVPWLNGRALDLAQAGHALVVDAIDEAAFDAASCLAELRAAGLRTLISTRWTGAELALPETDVLRLGGLCRDEIEQVLRAVDGGPIADMPSIAAAIEDIAVPVDPAFAGADPLIVRFIAGRRGRRAAYRRRTRH